MAMPANPETKFLQEWVDATYPNSFRKYRQRLGRPVQLGNIGSADNPFAKNYRLWADAVIILPDKVILVEAKIYRRRDGVAQLKDYAKLFPETPELQGFKNLPLELVLVIPVKDPTVESFAEGTGIKVVVFEPSFQEDIIDKLTARQT